MMYSKRSIRKILEKYSSSKSRITASFLATLLITGGAFWLWSNTEPEITPQNLAKFMELTRRDPLFFDALTDAKLLQSAAKKMKEVDDLTLAVDQKFRARSSPANHDLLPHGWKIWPDEFLLTLPAIHRRTLELFSETSEKNALTLLKLYIQAADNYASAIKAHRVLLENLLEKDPELLNTQIVFLDSATTPDIVREDFRLISENAKALKKEIKLRYKCLYYGSCVTGSEVNSGKAQDNAIPELLPARPLSDGILGINRQKTDVAGPYWTPTPCFGINPDGTFPAHPFYILKKPPEISAPPIALEPILTNTKYFVDYSASPLPMAKFLVKQGINLKPQSYETNDYLCTDLRYLASIITHYLSSDKENLFAESNEGTIAALPYIMRNTYQSALYLRQDANFTRRPLNLLNLVIARSGYSVYFVTFSPSVWRIAEMPQFLLKQEPTVRKKGYLTYEELRDKGLSEEKIKKLYLIPPVKDILKKARAGN